MNRVTSISILKSDLNQVQSDCDWAVMNNSAGISVHSMSTWVCNVRLLLTVMCGVAPIPGIAYSHFPNQWVKSERVYRVYVCVCAMLRPNCNEIRIMRIINTSASTCPKYVISLGAKRIIFRIDWLTNKRTNVGVSASIFVCVPVFVFVKRVSINLILVWCATRPHHSQA